MHNIRTYRLVFSHSLVKVSENGVGLLSRMRCMSRPRLARIILGGGLDFKTGKGVAI